MYWYVLYNALMISYIPRIVLLSWPVQIPYSELGDYSVILSSM
jgi:hypothetical protein